MVYSMLINFMLVLGMVSDWDGFLVETFVDMDDSGGSPILGNHHVNVYPKFTQIPGVVFSSRSNNSLNVR